MFAIAHKPQSSLSYGLYITSTSPTSRERILFRVPTAHLSSIADSSNFLAFAKETHPPGLCPTVDWQLRPAHPTDFRNFTFSACPLVGAFHGVATILRPDSRVSPHPLTSFCQMRGFSGNCAETATIHNLVARELMYSATRILGPTSASPIGGITPLRHDEIGFVDAPFPAAGILPDSPVSVRRLSRACAATVNLGTSFVDAPRSVRSSLPYSHVSAEVSAPVPVEISSLALQNSQKMSFFRPGKDDARSMASQSAKGPENSPITELPPSLQRRNIRKRTEAEEAEREGRRTNRNRAAATRANARRRFVRDQLEAAERQVVVLKSRRLALVEENEALRKRELGPLYAVKKSF